MTGDNLSVSLIDAESDENMESLTGIIKVDTLFADDDEIIHYIIDPEPSELQEMINNDVFSDQYIFNKIPD